MIQLRNSDGSVTPVSGQFVEIVADNGDIGMVLFTSGSGVVQVLPGSTDAHRYETMFRKYGAKFNTMLVQRR